MPQEWVVAKYLLREEVGSTRMARRYLALADILPAQEAGSLPAWDEVEGLGGYAVALVDVPDLSVLDGEPDVKRLPAIGRTEKLRDHLDGSNRTVLRDILDEQGYARSEIAARLGANLDSDLATLDGFLRMSVTRRLKPRFDAALNDVVVDGPEQWVKPLPADLRAQFPFGAPILDNFNRTDEDPAVGWALVLDAGDELEVVSNEGQGNGAAFCKAYWDDTSFSGEIAAFVTLATASVSGQGVLYSLQDEGTSTWDGYELGAYDILDDIFLERVDNNSFTTLGSSFSQAGADGDKVGGHLLSGTHEVYYDTGGGWSSLGTRSDSTYTSGFIGVRSGAAIQIDDFGAGTIGTAGVAAPNPKRQSMRRRVRI